ncbi:MAG: FAD:protein FMN transferase [Chlorobiaceae bacterium]
MEIFRFAFQAMASRCEVVLASASKDKAVSVARLAIDEISRIERKYSRYEAESIVSMINAAAGVGFVECDEETLSLMGYADILYESSDGLFDITAGILRKAWNFNHAVVPHSVTLSPLLDLIGWKKVERKSNAIRLHSAGMELDFGGFGKEYAADRAAAMLQEQGVKHGYVNLGGDIRVVGTKPDGSSWTIAIQDPRHKDQAIASIPLRAGALATSGDYERFFEVSGNRYCHILNPCTGIPVTYWRSVTVVAPLAITAGSYSTIAMLKEAEGLAFLKDSGFGYLAVNQSGKIFHKNVQ